MRKKYITIHGTLNTLLPFLLLILTYRTVYSNPTIAYYVETSGSIDDEKAIGLNATFAGYLNVVGWTRSYGAESTDVFISKYDQEGNHVATKVFGGTKSEYPYSMIITSDEKIVTTGYTRNFSWGDLFISKFDANLNHEWTRVFDYYRTDMGFSLTEVSNGNYIVAGLTTSSGFPNLLLTEFDATGNLQWQNGLANGFCSQAYGITRTYDGAVAVTGYYAPSSPIFRIPLISKFSADGTHQWTKLMTLPNSAYGTAITETGTQNIALAGVMFRPSSSTWDLFIAKFDSLGNNLWVKVIDDSKIDTVGIPVAIGTVSGTYLVVVGSTSRWGMNGDILISMFNENGNHIYTRAFGSDSLDQGSALLSSYGRYLIAGSTKGWDAISQDIFVSTFYIDGHTCTDVDTINPLINTLVPSMDTLEPQIYNPAQSIHPWSPTIINANPISSFVCWESSGEVKETESSSLLMKSLKIPSIVQDEIILRFGYQSMARLNLTLFSSEGKAIFSTSFDYTPFQIKIRGRKIDELSNGVYFIRLKSKDISVVMKIIKIAK